MSTILDLARSLTVATTAPATRSRRVGDSTLARDGRETREVTATTRVVPAKVATIPEARAVLVIKVLANGDLADCAARHGRAPAAYEAKALQCAAALQLMLQEEKLPETADGLMALIAGCMSVVDAGRKAGTIKAAAFGPSEIASLRLAECADYNRILALMPGAADKLAAEAAAKAAAEQAKADAKAKKAAQAAALAKPIAKAPLKSLSAMAWNG